MENLPLDSFWNFWKDTPDGSVLEEAEQLRLLESSLCPSEVWHASVFCKEFLFHKDYANVEIWSPIFYQSPVSRKSQFGRAGLSTWVPSLSMALDCPRNSSILRALGDYFKKTEFQVRWSLDKVLIVYDTLISLIRWAGIENGLTSKSI